MQFTTSSPYRFENYLNLVLVVGRVVEEQGSLGMVGGGLAGPLVEETAQVGLLVHAGHGLGRYKKSPKRAIRVVRPANLPRKTRILRLRLSAIRSLTTTGDWRRRDWRVSYDLAEVSALLCARRRDVTFFLTADMLGGKFGLWGIEIIVVVEVRLSCFNFQCVITKTN